MGRAQRPGCEADDTSWQQKVRGEKTPCKGGIFPLVGKASALPSSNGEMGALGDQLWTAELGSEAEGPHAKAHRIASGTSVCRESCAALVQTPSRTASGDRTQSKAFLITSLHI